jgi:hypothetical protein
MLLTLIAVLISIPVGILVNLLTPWFKTQISVRSQTLRAERIKKLKESFWEIEQVRAGNLTNKFIGFCALLILRVSIYLWLALFLVVSLVEDIDRYSLKPPMLTFSLWGKYDERVTLAYTEILVFLAITAAVIVSYGAVRRISRVVSDAAYDQYRNDVERNLNKLGSSLNEPVQESADETTKASPNFPGLP